MTQFPHLFSPIRLGPTTIKNRIVSLPHGTRLGSGGNSTEREALYFAEKAKGGTGLIIHGALMMDETTWMPGAYVRVDRDECIPGLRRVADSVHQYGTRIIGQLLHLGRQRYVGSFMPVSMFRPFLSLFGEKAHGKLNWRISRDWSRVTGEARRE